MKYIDVRIFINENPIEVTHLRLSNVNIVFGRD